MITPLTTQLLVTTDWDKYLKIPLSEYKKASKYLIIFIFAIDYPE